MIPIAKRFAHVGHILQKRERWSGVQDGFAARHISQSDKKKGYWYLSWLGILSTHGRKGLGQQLLQWGLDRADEHDQAIYLSASPQGVGLYRKAGFEVVEALLCYPEEEKGNWTESYMRRPRRSEREGNAKKYA
jgi:ribosomal protein S18 acetylase RimI-like enzyme